MNVYIRPRTSVTETTLQADAKTWDEVLAFLRSSGMSRYGVFIEPQLRGIQEGIVHVTLPNETAQTIVRLLGYSA